MVFKKEENYMVFESKQLFFFLLSYVHLQNPLTSSDGGEMFVVIFQGQDTYGLSIGIDSLFNNLQSLSYIVWKHARPSNI